MLAFNDTLVTCLTPPGPTAEVTVAISLNDGVDFHYAPSSLLYRYTGASPPLLKTAAFDPSGSSVLLDFGQPTDMAQSETGVLGSCERLLTPRSLFNLGGSQASSLVKCRWADPLTLVVQLSAQSWPHVPAVGDIIQLVDGQIAPASEQGCERSVALCNFNSSALLERAPYEDVPLAVAVVPPVISACEVATLLC